MSQLPLNIDFSQVLLHLFNVVILFAILYFLIYKPVKNFMDKRKKEYEDMDAQAAGKVKEAQELKESYEARLSAAEEEIRAMKSEAAARVDSETRSAQEKARQEAEQILAAARIQAEREKEKILGSTSEQVKELAAQAASKALFGNPSEAYDSFLKAASEGESR